MLPSILYIQFNRFKLAKEIVCHPTTAMCAAPRLCVCVFQTITRVHHRNISGSHCHYKRTDPFGTDLTVSAHSTRHHADEWHMNSAPTDCGITKKNEHFLPKEKTNHLLYGIAFGRSLSKDLSPFRTISFRNTEKYNWCVVVICCYNASGSIGTSTM